MTPRPVPRPSVAAAAEWLRVYLREHPWPDAEAVRQAGHNTGHDDTAQFHARRWLAVEIVSADDGDDARIVPSADRPAHLAFDVTHHVTVIGLVCGCGDGTAWALVECHDPMRTLAFVEVPPEAADIVRAGTDRVLRLEDDS